MSEPTLEIDEILRPIETPEEDSSNLRREIRRERDKLKEDEEAFNHFRWYGAEYEGQPAPDEPEWQVLIRAASDVLADKSKDLWICAWMIEALTVQHGFAGLRDGFHVTAKIVELFWETIEPNPNGEDGPEGTVKMLASLNDSLLTDRINSIQISNPFEENDPLTCATLKTTEQTLVTNIAAATSVDFFIELTEDVASAITEFENLRTVLAEKCGEEFAPPTAKIRDSLDECQRLVRGFCGHLLPEDMQDAEDGEVSDEEGNGEEAISGGEAIATGKVQNREEAFRLLEKVADFFRRTEPHSPVSYELERAVRWGRMSLPDLLAEMVSDEQTKSEIFRLAGIRSDDDDRDD